MPISWADMWHFWYQLDSFENKVQIDFCRKVVFVGSLEASVSGETLPLSRRKGVSFAASCSPPAGSDAVPVFRGAL